MRLDAFAAASAALLLSACAPQPAKVAPKTDDEKTIYAVGVAIQKSLEAFNLTRPRWIWWWPASVTPPPARPT